MDSSLSSHQKALIDTPAASSAFSLLERGIACVRQGSYAEGVAFFALLREQLSPDMAHLAAALDTIIKSNINYWQAQQMLNLASKRFAEADAEQKSALLAIEKLLPVLSEKNNLVMQSRQKSQPSQFSNNQSQQPRAPLRLLTSGQTDSKFAANEPTILENLSKAGDILPDLYITCFGRFEVRRCDKTIALCHNRSGQAILRYLVVQSKYRASRDALMSIIWPEDAPEVALRKLQIAVSALRRSLNIGYTSDVGSGYILYKDPFYLLNPAVTIRTDVDEFLSLWQAGHITSGIEAVKFFEQATCLYTNTFLVEDMYADWSTARREKLSQIYLSMCHELTSYYLKAGHYEDAEKWVSEILIGDRCDEKAHQQLMYIYAVQGHRSETLRQYQRCKSILAEELGIAPASETENLLQTLLADTNSPLDEMERK